MTTKKKAARASTRTASKTAFNDQNNTRTDPLLGWLDLAKPALGRLKKGSWQKGRR
jgi:hypothetical protein